MLAAAVIGLAAVLFAAGILMVLFWCDYVEKREMLYVILAQHSLCGFLRLHRVSLWQLWAGPGLGRARCYICWAGCDAKDTASVKEVFSALGGLVPVSFDSRYANGAVLCIEQECQKRVDCGSDTLSGIKDDAKMMQICFMLRVWWI